MEHHVKTSRGEVIIHDSHIFEVVVPVSEQLILSFQGESISFSVKGWLDRAKEIGHDGKKITLDKLET